MNTNFSEARIRALKLLLDPGIPQRIADLMATAIVDIAVDWDRREAPALVGVELSRAIGAAERAVRGRVGDGM